jgi:uncharacterized protein (DUF1015 family)
MMSRLTAISSGHAFGIYAGAGQFYLLKLKDPKESDKAMMNKAFAWRRLDVSILHLFIFQRLLDLPDGDDDIEFFKNPEDAVKCVDKKDGRAAFFLNPTRVWQVRRIAKLGERMPRKATYFYPKPLSGLVVYKF